MHLVICMLHLSSVTCSVSSFLKIFFLTADNISKYLHFCVAADAKQHSLLLSELCI